MNTPTNTQKTIDENMRINNMATQMVGSLRGFAERFPTRVALQVACVQRALRAVGEEDDDAARNYVERAMWAPSNAAGRWVEMALLRRAVDIAVLQVSANYYKCEGGEHFIDTETFQLKYDVRGRQAGKTFIMAAARGHVHPLGLEVHGLPDAGAAAKQYKSGEYHERKMQILSDPRSPLRATNSTLTFVLAPPGTDVVPVAARKARTLSFTPTFVVRAPDGAVLQYLPQQLERLACEVLAKYVVANGTPRLQLERIANGIVELPELPPQRVSVLGAMATEGLYLRTDVWEATARLCMTDPANFFDLAYAFPVNPKASCGPPGSALTALFSGPDGKERQRAWHLAQAAEVVVAMRSACAKFRETPRDERTQRLLEAMADQLKARGWAAVMEMKPKCDIYETEGGRAEIVDHEGGGRTLVLHVGEQKKVRNYYVQSLMLRHVLYPRTLLCKFTLPRERSMTTDVTEAVLAHVNDPPAVFNLDGNGSSSRSAIGMSPFHGGWQAFEQTMLSEVISVGVSIREYGDDTRTITQLATERNGEFIEYELPYGAKTQPGDVVYYVYDTDFKAFDTANRNAHPILRRAMAIMYSKMDEQVEGEELKTLVRELQDLLVPLEEPWAKIIASKSLVLLDGSDSYLASGVKSGTVGLTEANTLIANVFMSMVVQELRACESLALNDPAKPCGHFVDVTLYPSGATGIEAADIMRRGDHARKRPALSVELVERAFTSAADRFKREFGVSTTRESAYVMCPAAEQRWFASQAREDQEYVRQSVVLTPSDLSPLGLLEENVEKLTSPGKFIGMRSVPIPGRVRRVAPIMAKADLVRMLVMQKNPGGGGEGAERAMPSVKSLAALILGGWAYPSVYKWCKTTYDATAGSLTEQNIGGLLADYLGQEEKMTLGTPKAFPSAERAMYWVAGMVPTLFVPLAATSVELPHAEMERTVDEYSLADVGSGLLPAVAPAGAAAGGGSAPAAPAGLAPLDLSEVYGAGLISPKAAPKAKSGKPGSSGDSAPAPPPVRNPGGGGGDLFSPRPRPHALSPLPPSPPPEASAPGGAAAPAASPAAPAGLTPAAFARAAEVERKATETMAALLNAKAVLAKIGPLTRSVEDAVGKAQRQGVADEAARALGVGPTASALRAAVDAGAASAAAMPGVARVRERTTTDGRKVFASATTMEVGVAEEQAPAVGYGADVARLFEAALVRAAGGPEVLTTAHLAETGRKLLWCAAKFYEAAGKTVRARSASGAWEYPQNAVDFVLPAFREGARDVIAGLLQLEAPALRPGRPATVATHVDAVLRLVRYANVEEGARGRRRVENRANGGDLGIVVVSAAGEEVLHYAPSDLLLRWTQRKGGPAEDIAEELEGTLPRAARALKPVSILRVPVFGVKAPLRGKPGKLEGLRAKPRAKATAKVTTGLGRQRPTRGAALTAPDPYEDAAPSDEEGAEDDGFDERYAAYLEAGGHQDEDAWHSADGSEDDDGAEAAAQAEYERQVELSMGRDRVMDEDITLSR